MGRTRVLVTGGAGFLGSHLCERLVESRADVLCLDNFLTGSRANIEHLLSLPNFELIRHDVVSPILLEVDQIYNLACPASPLSYRKNPVKTVKTSVMGAINMLGLAKRVGARILQASASEVYGLPQAVPVSEKYRGNVNPIGLRACYSEGKRVAETLMMDYRSQNGVDVVIARIFNTYGPRMAEDDGRVVSGFIVRALHNEPMIVHGDGSQTRSFCYVTDVVEGLVALMGRIGFRGPVNLGAEKEISVLDLARLIRDLTGSRSEILYAESTGPEPERMCPDISLARSELSWEPGVELTEGLLKTVEHFRSKIGPAMA
ncbi:MAG: UDP-glucuronic acid decarboxylase family protein [Thermodesulfobacteriota bacterium]